MTDPRITTIREALGDSNAHFALDSLAADLAAAEAEIERLQDRMSMAAEILTRPDTTND